MATRLYVTTNAALDAALSVVDVLIDWAKADAQHAEENDAPNTAADDRWRAKRLEHARILIEQCKREE